MIYDITNIINVRHKLLRAKIPINLSALSHLNDGQGITTPTEYKMRITKITAQPISVAAQSSVRNIFLFIDLYNIFMLKKLKKQIKKEW
jgi:hypothetical protein